MQGTMETIKSYTDLEQSKKLAEFLPFESADMFCADVFNKEKETHSHNFHILSTWGCNTFEDLKDRKNKFVHFIPCWSLVALFKLLPNCIEGAEPLLIKTFRNDYRIVYNIDGGEDITSEDYTNPIDACYEMIIKLHESSLL